MFADITVSNTVGSRGTSLVSCHPNSHHNGQRYLAEPITNASSAALMRLKMIENNWLRDIITSRHISPPRYDHNSSHISMARAVGY